MNKPTKRTKKAAQALEDKKDIITAAIAIVLTIVMTTLMFTQQAAATTDSFASYPKSFIPFWSQARRGFETTLLNTNQIVRIEPIFDPSVDEPDHNDIVYLRVHLTDGKSITVEEDFEDFYSRVRVSQAK